MSTSDFRIFPTAFACFTKWLVNKWKVKKVATMLELAKTDVYCFLICIVLLSSCQGAPRFDSKKGWADVMSSWARSPSKHRLVHKSPASRLVRAPQLFCTSKIFFLSVMDQRGMKYFLCVWWLRGTAKRTATLDRPSWGTRRCQTALNFQQITKTHFLSKSEIILMILSTNLKSQHALCKLDIFQDLKIISNINPWR